MLRKHARLIFLLLLCSLLTGLVLYVYARPVYSSRSLLLLDTPDASRAQSAMRELVAPHVAERTARRLGVRGSAREIASRFVFKQAVRADANGALEIEVWAASADLAVRWPKALVEELAGDASSLRYRRLQEVIATYGQELREVAAKLGEPLDPSFEIKSQADVARVLGVLQKSAPAELVRIGQRLNKIGRVRIELIDPALSTLEKLALLAPLQEPGAEGSQELGKEQERLAAELSAAERAEPQDEARIRMLGEQLGQIRAKLDAEYAELRGRIDREYQTLLARKTELEVKMPAPLGSSDAGGELHQRAAVSTMSRTPWAEMAAELQRKIEAIENDPAAAVPRIRFGGLTALSETPLAPRRAQIGATALAFGLALAVFVPLLIEVFGHLLSGPRYAGSRLGLRALGTVPPLDASSTEALKSFDVILADLRSSSAARVIMVTSAVAREGKTITAMQLAIASAATGTSTLLLDGDLRSGRVHRLFGYRRSPGLSDVLLGEAAREKACRPAPHEHLSICAAGRPVEDPAALLGSQRFTELMTAFREEFACVIVDAPAVLGLSETSILQRQVDGVLLVVESRTPRGKLDAAHETLRVNGARVFGFVVNSGAPATALQPA